jgi:Tol biopolymer transport system component
MPSEGGKPVRFTQGSASNTRPSWSHDGKWIYYCASGNGGPQIWKKPVEGGSEIQVTKNGGCDQIESADGKSVYYLKDNDRALWRVPTHGGQESKVVAFTDQIQFTLGSRGAYILEAGNSPRLKYLDFSTGSIKIFGTVPGFRSSQFGLTVSPDEQWLLYGQSELAGSQLMLVDKFR